MAFTDVPLYPTIRNAMPSMVPSMVPSIEPSVSLSLRAVLSTSEQPSIPTTLLATEGLATPLPPSLSTQPLPSSAISRSTVSSPHSTISSSPLTVSLSPPPILSSHLTSSPSTPQPNPSLHSSTTKQQHKVLSSQRTRNGRNRYGDVSKWNAYFNHYRTVHTANINTTKKVVYLKRGTTGIAGQIIGICDSLFIAMITDRALQCPFSFPTSSLVSSDVITDKYFSFPLPNVYVPLNSTVKR